MNGKTQLFVIDAKGSYADPDIKSCAVGAKIIIYGENGEILTPDFSGAGFNKAPANKAYTPDVLVKKIAETNVRKERQW